MYKKTAVSLCGLSAVLIITGVLAMNPALGFLLFVCAAAVAVIAAVRSVKRVRGVAIGILVIAVICAAAGYPSARDHLEQYRTRNP